MLKLSNIKYKITCTTDVSDNSLLDYASNLLKKKYHITPTDIILLKKSLDNRKADLLYVLSIGFSASNESYLLNKYHELELLLDDPNYLYIKNLKISSKVNKQICVVGMGPSGIFSSLILSEAGFDVVILERGKKVEDRIIDIENFRNLGIFSESSNVQFGEGGAGTFSDGKLASSIKSPYTRFVLETFVRFGAPSNILYDALPHIGSDILQKMLINMRNHLLSLGVKIYYEAKLVDFTNNECIIDSKKITHLSFDYLLLACGHSASDIYELLFRKGCLLKPKPFALGVRIEHLQDDLNHYQYKGDYPNLPSADYKVVMHLDNNRTMYSFCMCPGGVVVNAMSSAKQMVVNGMSYSKRDLTNCNSALLINVNIDDYYVNSPLDGLKFLQKYERLAYYEDDAGLPLVVVQKVSDFIKGIKTTSLGRITPSVKPYYTLGSVYEMLPSFVCASLKEGLIKLGEKIPFFNDGDAIISGIESRSSAPLQVVRDDSYQSSIPFVYVIGEASGYSGGITTCSIDGIKCAISIIRKEGLNNG